MIIPNQHPCQVLLMVLSTVWPVLGKCVREMAVERLDKPGPFESRCPRK